MSRRLAVAGGVLASCLMLAGCFTSEKPLIGKAHADYPFKDGAHFTEEIDCAHQPSLACQPGESFHTASSGVLHVKAGQYVMKPDAGSAFAMAAGTPGGNKDAGMLLKHLGGNLYLVQADLGPGAANGFGRYIYELMRLDGRDAYLYAFMCEQNGDKQYVKAHDLAGIDNQIGLPICKANSIAGLAAIFRARLANGEVPNERMVF